MKSFRSLLLISIVLGCGVYVPAFAQVNVSPILLDEEAEPRDIITKEITVTNESDSRLVVFATVNEILVDEAGTVKEFVSPAMTDGSQTVTSWIEISRGRIEFEPGEKKVIPITIRVHPYAKPGSYHAFIGFVSSSKRFEAEAQAMAGNAKGVLLKVSLKEESNEVIRIAGFLVDRFIFKDDQRSIDIEVENSGDADTTPTGEIIFYNARGEEVSSHPVNQDLLVIKPGEKKVITSEVPFSDKVGRFKANLVLRYGADQKATVFDTVQFFMAPYWLLIIFAIGVASVSLLLTFLIRRTFREERYSDDEGHHVPLFVRSDRSHDTKDHDIHLTKN